MMRYCSILFGILFSLVIASSALAQSDHFGEIDRIYLDSVGVVQGQEVSIHVFMKNDESISIISVPLTYDTSLLHLKAISFEGSRAAAIQTKIVTPSNISEIQGHFVVAIILLTEAPIPAGDGLLFTATFTPTAAAIPGTSALVDSLFFPPGGELVLTENTTTQ